MWRLKVCRVCLRILEVGAIRWEGHVLCRSCYESLDRCEDGYPLSQLELFEGGGGVLVTYDERDDKISGSWGRSPPQENRGPEGPPF